MLLDLWQKNICLIKTTPSAAACSSCREHAPSSSFSINAIVSGFNKSLYINGSHLGLLYSACGGDWPDQPKE